MKTVLAAMVVALGLTAAAAPAEHPWDGYPAWARHALDHSR